MQTATNTPKVVILGTAHGSNVPGKRSPDGKFREYKFSREVINLLKPRLPPKRNTMLRRLAQSPLQPQSGFSG